MYLDAALSPQFCIMSEQTGHESSCVNQGMLFHPRTVTEHRLLNSNTGAIYFYFLYVAGLLSSFFFG